MGRVKRVRSPRVSKGRAQNSHSPLRDPLWAVINDEVSIIGLRHRKAVQVARDVRGIVVTNNAANRQSGVEQ